MVSSCLGKCSFEMYFYIATMFNHLCWTLCSTSKFYLRILKHKHCATELNWLNWATIYIRSKACIHDRRRAYQSIKSHVQQSWKIDCASHEFIYSLKMQPRKIRKCYVLPEFIYSRFSIEAHWKFVVEPILYIPKKKRSEFFVF